MALLRSDLERTIVRLAIPALGTLAVEPVYVLIDTAIVGRLGTPQLAGMAIASIVLLNVIAVLNALEYVTPDIAHAMSAGRPEDAYRTASHGAWLSCIVGVPAAVLLAALARPDDAYRQAIANAPEDDESITAEDLAAIEEGWDDYESGASVSEEDLLKRLAQ